MQWTKHGVVTQALQQAVLQLTGPLVQLATPALELVHRLRRLFFLNEGQDFSRFLVRPLRTVPQTYKPVVQSRLRPRFC